MLCWAQAIGVDQNWETWVKEFYQWHPTPVFLPGKSHGQRRLVGCSPWGRKESDTTEQLHFHFSLSCIEERNGNPLQCSCLEHPRDRGAWWAAIYGVAQSRTQLKWLSSSSSSSSLSKPVTMEENAKGAIFSPLQFTSLRQKSRIVDEIIIFYGFSI